MEKFTNTCENCEHDFVRDGVGKIMCDSFNTCSWVDKERDHFIAWPIPRQELFHYD